MWYRWVPIQRLSSRVSSSLYGCTDSVAGPVEPFIDYRSLGRSVDPLSRPQVSRTLCGTFEYRWVPIRDYRSLGRFVEPFIDYRSLGRSVEPFVTTGLLDAL